MDWHGPESELGRVVSDQSSSCLAVYAEDPSRVEQDARIELEAAEGGYGRKQLFELIQNAADAMQGEPGPIQVVLTDRMLYIANAGQPFSPEGVRSLLASHLSRKSEEHIGQFGLGFKSVVAITDQVSIFSRSGSFEFDGAWAASQIRDTGIEQARYPLLRLARPLSPDEHAATDRELAKLMDWASTIIRIPLTKSGSYKSLAEDIKKFPAAFLLFSQGVTELRLDDHGSEMRTIRLEHNDEHLCWLTDNGERSEWLVVSAKHVPSRAALADAGELNRREVLELSWAAQRHTQTHSLGGFWAFFPTSIKTSLSGIVNAPWKLSADRLTMIEGKFNEELLTEVLPAVVAKGLRLLHRADDPAAMIDVLPARGKEGRSWADDTINQPVIDAAARSESLPNLSGTPSIPSNLALHPQGLPPAWKGIWSTKNPTAWVHHSIDKNPERRLKAQRLIASGGGKDLGLPLWLGSMAADKSPGGSAQALFLARRIAEDVPSLRSDVVEVPSVLLEDERLVRPIRGKVFLRSEGDADDHDYIHPALANLPGVAETLEFFGIEVLNPVGELHAALQLDPSGPQWSRIWPLIRKVNNVDQAFHILREELKEPLVYSIFARVRSGKWRPLAECFLPGEILSPDRSEDVDFLIDERLHSPDLSLLQRSGAVSAPRLAHGMPDEPWLTAFKIKCQEQFRAKIKQPRLQDNSVAVEGPPTLWPLELLSLVSEPARVAITQKMLELGSLEPWTVFHRTNSSIPRITAHNPAVLRIARHGRIPTTVGPMRHDMCLHPDSEVPDFFPIAEVSTAWAEALELPGVLDHWDEHSWRLLMSHTEKCRPDDLPNLYAQAADWDISVPPEIRASRTGISFAKVPHTRVAVTDSPATHSSLLTAGISSLLVTDDWQREVLIEKWGLADGRLMLKEETVAVPSGQPSYLTDRFPPLKRFASEIEDLDSLMLQPCTTIDLLISTPNGQETSRRTFHREGLTINVQNGTDSQVLTRIGQALNVRINVSRILEEIEQSKTNALRARILGEPSSGRKLVIAVGADNLRGRLPRSAIQELEAAQKTQLSGEALAELALAVHGYDILRELRNELADSGLEPPRQWAGSRDARSFVTGLGFEAEYAGFPGNRLDPILAVDGPAKLPELHGYQREVVTRIQRLLTSGTATTRGMVTLPTGAGKTRVASQSVIELVARGQLGGPVLWVGQSEELCEQAVQSWAFVWRAIGEGPMTISRFWSSNEVDQASPGVFQIVVATIDKLNNAMEKPQYDWLKDVTLIIVDEAHTSIASSYTKVFQRLSGEALTTRMKTPLLGLTATAYRGSSEDETARLIGRYQSNKIDDGVFGDEQPYSYLQKHGVLATVRQQLLDGMDIAWTEEVGRHISTFGTLPGEVEQEIGRNATRNKVILDSIRALPDDWTLLLFASSVDHARTMAAQLSYYNVPARPIDGTTDPALRRRYIEQFRAGEIRVLTNYNVLTQGFDAPTVRAVYVARPTFSLNLYQQMIGRGLRGPKNGGSEEVLIVNVRDNIQKYGEQLAFQHFDYLWRGSDEG